VIIAEELVNELVAGCDHLMNKLDIGELQGAAYSTGKGLFNTKIIPSVHKIQGVIDDIKVEIQSYEYAHSVVAEYGTVLDRDELEAQWEAEKLYLQKVEQQIRDNMRFVQDAASLSSGVGNGYEHYEPERALERVRENKDLIQVKEQLELRIADIETRINKLDWFETEVNNYFSDSLEILNLSLKATVELNALTFDAQGNFHVSKGLKLDALGAMINAKIVTENAAIEMIKMLQEVYGFSKEVACDIQELMILMDMANPKFTDKDLAVELMVLFGSVSYGNPEGFLSQNFQWDQATGKNVLTKPEFIKKLKMLGFSYTKANNLYEAIESQHTLAGFPDSVNEMEKHIATKIDDDVDIRNAKIVKYLINTGMSDSEAARLVFADDKTELYNKLTQYSSKPDFSHMMITGATELNNSSGILANIRTFGRTVPAAGWFGDISHIAGSPSMGNDDYKADLDATNISRRIAKGDGTFEAVLREYYNEIKNGKTNRAKEFKTHYSTQDITNEINAVDLTGKRVVVEELVDGELDIMITYDNSQKDTLNSTAKRS